MPGPRATHKLPLATWHMAHGTVCRPLPWPFNTFIFRRQLVCCLGLDFNFTLRYLNSALIHMYVHLCVYVYSYLRAFINFVWRRLAKPLPYLWLPGRPFWEMTTAQLGFAIGNGQSSHSGKSRKIPCINLMELSKSNRQKGVKYRNLWAAKLHQICCRKRNIWMPAARNDSCKDSS